MRAELIAVGTELLRFGRTDTNGEWMTERLQRIGFTVSARAQVEDDTALIADTVRVALERADAVLVTGGLGPTEDDRTRAGIAAALGVELERDLELLERMKVRYADHGVALTAEQARQADRPRGAEWIVNPLGSAQGLLVVRNDTLLAVLPGVPSEMKGMATATVLPRLAARGQVGVALRRLRVAGRSEASVDRQLRDLYEVEGVEVTLLGAVGGIEIHVHARADEATRAAARADDVVQEMARRLGEDLAGAGDETLAETVGHGLVACGRRVATAESCTGGLLGAELTTVAGSSKWYAGGLVVYSDRLKTQLAGVRPETLLGHGAVSEAVARELARGACERCGADVGVGITGIAGPGGGSDDKPVGLVHLAVCWAGRESHWKLRLVGDRDTVRRRTVTVALDRLRRMCREESGAA